MNRPADNRREALERYSSWSYMTTSPLSQIIKSGSHERWVAAGANDSLEGRRPGPGIEPGTSGL